MAAKISTILNNPKKTDIMLKGTVVVNGKNMAISEYLKMQQDRREE